jgi:hypothetical protein
MEVIRPDIQIIAEIRHWFALDWRTILAACGALISFIAAMIAIVNILRTSEERKPDEIQPEQRVLRLACGDAKALTRLAIQRNWDDQTFFQRLHADSCYEILLSHFSDQFRQQLEQFASRTGSRMSLADACYKEVERLEHKLEMAMKKSE